MLLFLTVVQSLFKVVAIFEFFREYLKECEPESNQRKMTALQIPGNSGRLKTHSQVIVTLALFVHSPTMPSPHYM